METALCRGVKHAMLVYSAKSLAFVLKNAHKIVYNIENNIESDFSIALSGAPSHLGVKGTPMTELQDFPLTADLLSDRLELAIHEHRLAPGTKLGEDEIGEIYGVSRTIVRAALQSLSHQKLVELRRNKGAYVAQPTIKEAREVFEARALLEPRTAHSAARRITSEQLAGLQQHIDAEHAATAQGEHGRALYLSGQFHIEIAKIADQETIASFIQQLISRSSLIIALYWQRRSALCESNAHHALMKAFELRDAERAQDLMNSHLVDLMTSLDLRNMTSTPMTLRDALLK